MASPPSGRRRYYLAGLCSIPIAGAFLRLSASLFCGSSAPLRSIAALYSASKFHSVGFDEGLYHEYVNALIKNEITFYPDVVEACKHSLNLARSAKHRGTKAAKLFIDGSPATLRNPTTTGETD
jgi:hypothetical protein